MKSDNQIRHEKLIEFLNSFQQFQRNGKPILKKVDKVRYSSDFKDIDINDINHAVVAFVDVLNLSGGSVGGDIDLYKLLQSYITDLDKREAINKIIKP